MPENVGTDIQASENLNVAEEVTDKDLNDAYDALFGNGQGTPEVEPEPEAKPEPEPEPEVTPVEEEDIDQVERSRLGRKVKELRDNMATKQDLAQILAKLDELRSVPVTPTQVVEPELEEEIQDITNVHELNQYLDKYIERREVKRNIESQEKIKKYRENYMSTLSDLGKNLDQEEFVEVFDTMKEKFNDVNWNDPVKECTSNFSKALVYVMKNKTKNPANKFEQNRNSTPTPVTTPSSPSTRSQDLPELDEIAADFVRRVGMSEQSVKDALSRETKPGLTGIRKTR